MMLHRSFKPAKCKTSLRLAVARIKLLKNKRETQVKQLKRELAQLLESGQEKTARIRVEHVVREEKTMAAYELVEIYCELIVARLPIIESQKNCPIDLKEAITTVIFASPRCADIPELLDIRKHFTAKYGKEFVSSALELRPDCGVNRTMVEKLSARAPDGETKIKILTTIAQEHNIKWDPNTSGENEPKPPEDLLNRPSSFETPSKLHVEPPNVHLPTTPDYKHESSVRISENNDRSSRSSQTFPSSDRGNHNITMSEMRPSGIGTKEREFGHKFSDDKNEFYSNRQNWSMGFKDATSAAQAAAESAERASMAARAAAELSSRGNIRSQYSTESHESAYGVKNGGSEKPFGPKFQGKPVATDSASTEHNSMRSSYDVNPRMQNQQEGRIERDNMPKRASLAAREAAELSNREKITSQYSTESHESSVYGVNYGGSEKPCSPKFQGKPVAKDSVRTEHNSMRSSYDMNPRMQNQREERNEQDNMPGVTGGIYNGHDSTKRSGRPASPGPSVVSIDNDTLASNLQNADIHSQKSSSVEGISLGWPIQKPEKVDFLGDVSINKPCEESEAEFVNQQYQMKKSENAYGSGEGLIRKVSSKSASYDSHASDDSDENDSITNFNIQRYGKDDLDSSTNTFQGNMQEDTRQPHSDDYRAAVFDESDSDDDRNFDIEGESQEEMNKQKFSGRKESSSPSYEHSVYTRNSASADSGNHELTGSSIANKESTGVKPWSRSSSDDYISEETLHDKRKEVDNKNIRGQSGKTYDLGDLPTDHTAVEVKQQPLLSSRPSVAQEVDSEDDIDALQMHGLSLGKLTGGLRNKGYRHPPYTRDLSGDASPVSTQQTQGTPAIIGEPTVLPVDTSQNRDRESLNQKVHVKVRKELSSRARKTFFDSDDDDDTEDIRPRQTIGTKGNVGGRISCRTRGSSPNSEAGTGSVSMVQPEEPVTSYFGVGEKSSSKSSSATEPLTKLHSHMGNSETGEQSGSRRISSSVEKPSSKSMPMPYTSVRKEASKLFTVEQPSIPLSKTVSSGGTESSKTLISSGGLASRENSTKKASHVHPKLPDYDTFASHFKSLRSNRQ